MLADSTMTVAVKDGLCQCHGLCPGRTVRARGTYEAHGTYEVGIGHAQLGQKQRDTAHTSRLQPRRPDSCATSPNHVVQGSNAVQLRSSTAERRAPRAGECAV